MKLRQKMLLGSSLLAVLPVVVTSTLVSGVSTELAETSLIDQTRQQLTTIRELKREQVSGYLRLVTGQVQSFSADPDARAALTALAASFPDYAEQASAGQAASRAQLAEWRAALEAFYAGAFSAELERRAAEADAAALMEGLDDDALALQYHYLVANESPLGFKDELMAADDGSRYSTAHAVHHPVVRRFLTDARDTTGYEDVLLVNQQGRVVYSVAKGPELGASLAEGALADSALGRVVREAAAAPSPNDIAFADFERYLPAFGEPAAFLASPVFDGPRRLGVLVVHLSADRLNGIMNSAEAWRRVGLRETGETYLVGVDGTLRNDSRFLVEARDRYLDRIRSAGVSPPIVESIARRNSSVLLQPVDTPATEGAFAGRSGFQSLTDYRGETVYSTFAPFSVHGVSWALVSQLDRDEALAPVAELRQSALGWSALVGLAILLLGGGAGLLFTRTVTRPVQHLEDTVRRLAEGDDSARAHMSTGDELQTLGDAFDNLLDERIAQYQQAAWENEQLNNSIIELLQAVAQLSEKDLTVKVPVTEDVTGPLADAINQMVSEIGTLLQDVRGTAEQAGVASVRLKQQADQVKAIAAEEGDEVERMSSELDAAAQAMEQIAELAARCDRIAIETGETTATALQTVNTTVNGMGVIRELTHETEKRIKRLGERSQEISGIIDIINTLAERTHVLALNAAMQAAAAGESGRGFAVVADEVQRLAESSRDATAQISGLIRNIQVDTADTIATMGRTIGEVVEGSRMAEEAGQQMQRTRSTTTELLAAVKDIASGSQQQARVSSRLREAAGSVRQSTQNTRGKLDEQTQQTNRLVLHSKRLMDGIKVFKLPARERPAQRDVEQVNRQAADAGSGRT